MQPVKITIPGNYWDVHLYMGKLYLWTMDGSIIVYDWRKLIESLISNGADELAMRCAFLNGSYLYDRALKPFTSDGDIGRVLSRKFDGLNKDGFKLSTSGATAFLLGEQANPFGEMPTDQQIYRKRIYAATDTGLWSASVESGTRKPISSRPMKIWDCPLFSIVANRFSQIALSAGSEGLFEYSGNDITQYGQKSEVQKGIHQISSNHSLFANYAGLSVYNTSNIGSSSLALFEWNDSARSGDAARRVLKERVSEKQIFDNRMSGELSWGVEDKIYSVRDGGVRVVRFNNYAKREGGEKRFSIAKSIQLQSWKGDVIAGGVAYFGIIIECENALVVARSDGEFLNISDPVTKWRVYPRSMEYENHLHVVHDDRVDIYSFNHDVFVDQTTKDLGISRRTEWYKGARRFRNVRG